MNKFDLTKARPQWLVALVALMLTFALVVPGCASDTADDNAAETPTEKAAQAAEDEGPLEAGEAADDMTVTVSVTMPEGTAADNQTLEVTVPAESTVYDALVATGWDVRAEDSDYGKFVTSINGVANGSEGEASGWVYTVNGEQVMEGCDAKTLAAGDSAEWSFYVG